MAAEGTVTFLLDKLAPLLKLGSKLLKDVHKEVDYIVSELERIKAFLRFADAREETDPELKVWVKQVREVADEMEDVVDEFRLCPPQHHGHGLLGSIHKIARYSKDFKAQNQLVSRIQGIKSKVQNISEGHERYRGKFDGIEQGFGHGASTNTWYDSRGDALLVEESELVGIDKPKQKLIGMLLDDVSRTKVVSVVGMGGLGKTTLVKKVYDDVKVEKSFQHHAWVTVSSSKIEDLLRDLIQQLFEEGGNQSLKE
ncbi:Disease resistance protein RPM1 [Vitis vinifera]|uniref:Disease resistance protein RPM1 n=1 Tax=Vitis vinifera TaxID=29760 RepID=A0A438F639_VITVI|nr:Disease resistance protein RPM1 [Vitis vinifera]